MDWDDILEDYSLSCGFMRVSVFCVAFHFLVYHAVILHHVRCSARRVADDGLAQPQILDPNHRFHHFPCLNMFEPFPRFYRVLHRLAPSCTCEVSEWQQRSWGSGPKRQRRSCDAKYHHATGRVSWILKNMFR